jgi:hypothetical protein
MLFGADKKQFPGTESIILHTLLKINIPFTRRVLLCIFFLQTRLVYIIYTFFISPSTAITIGVLQPLRIKLAASEIGYRSNEFRPLIYGRIVRQKQKTRECFCLFAYFAAAGGGGCCLLFCLRLGRARGGEPRGGHVC